MKSILYAGAVLMAGACIYGFTEYRNTSSKEAFKEMYTEEKPARLEPVSKVTSDQEEITPVAEINPAKTEVIRKKSVRPVEEVTVTKSLSKPDRIDATNTAQISKDEVNVAPPEKMVIRKKKRRLNSKMFSRAPIREEQEEIILVPEKKKEEVKAVTASKEL